MTTILGIDPGPEKSGWVLYDTIRKRIEAQGISPIFEIATIITHAHVIWIEMVACYGMAVGADVLETAVNIGQIMTYGRCSNIAVNRITRPEVCHHLCHNRGATKAEVKTAIIDRFDPMRRFGKYGKGTKKNPGPLINIRDHEWDALAVALYGADQLEGNTQ